MKYEHYNRQADKSARTFQKLAVPLMQSKWNIDSVHICEGKRNYRDRKRDFEHATDYLLYKGGRWHGLAARVSFKRKYKNKFTIRQSRSNGTETELQKLENNSADKRPELICQACVVDDELLSCAAVRTEDLLQFIADTKPPLYQNYDPDKNQYQFYYTIDWLALKQAGVPLFILAET